MTDAIYPTLPPHYSNNATSVNYDTSRDYTSPNTVGNSIPSTPAENSRWTTPIASPSRPEEDSPTELKPNGASYQRAQAEPQTMEPMQYYPTTATSASPVEELYNPQESSIYTMNSSSAYIPSQSSCVTYDPYAVPSCPNQSVPLSYWTTNPQSQQYSLADTASGLQDSASPLLVAPISNTNDVPPSPYATATSPYMQTAATTLPLGAYYNMGMVQSDLSYPNLSNSQTESDITASNPQSQILVNPSFSLALLPPSGNGTTTGATKTAKSRAKKATTQQALMDIYTQNNQQILLTPTGRISKAKTARYRKQVMQANAVRIASQQDQSKSHIPASMSNTEMDMTNPLSMTYSSLPPTAYNSMTYSAESTSLNDTYNNMSSLPTDSTNSSMGSNSTLTSVNAIPTTTTYWDPTYTTYQYGDLSGVDPTQLSTVNMNGASAYTADPSYSASYPVYEQSYTVGNGYQACPPSYSVPTMYVADTTSSAIVYDQYATTSASATLGYDINPYDVYSSSVPTLGHEASISEQSVIATLDQNTSLDQKSSGEIYADSIDDPTISTPAPVIEDICLSEQYAISSDEQSYTPQTLVGENVSSIIPAGYTPAQHYYPFIGVKGYGKQDKSVVYNQCSAILARLDANPSVRFLWAVEEGTFISARGRSRNMCFATISKSLKRYRTTHQFAHDLRRVIENVLMHHPFGHPIRDRALRVWDLIVGMFSELNAPYHVALDKFQIRTVLPLLFFRSPLIEDLKYNSNVVSRKICRRLARRGGSPRPFWPSDWFKNAMQPITFFKMVAQTVYNPPCCSSCCSFSATTFTQARDQLAISSVAPIVISSTAALTSASSGAASSAIAEPTMCIHRRARAVYSGQTSPANSSSSIVGQTFFSPSTNNPRRVPVCENCNAECSLLKPTSRERSRKRVREVSKEAVREISSLVETAATTVVSSSSTSHPHSPSFNSTAPVVQNGELTLESLSKSSQSTTTLLCTEVGISGVPLPLDLQAVPSTTEPVQPPIKRRKQAEAPVAARSSMRSTRARPTAY